MAEKWTFLDYALWYAKHGFAVHPLRERDKIPILEGWQEKATTDLDTVRGWWERWPSANIGCVPALCDPPMVGFDIDPRKGADEAWLEMKAVHGQVIEDTWVGETGGGGLHVYFSVGENSVGNCDLPGGVEVHYSTNMVLPPSIHPDTGQRYQWAMGCAPTDRPVSPLPVTLANVISVTIRSKNRSNNAPRVFDAVIPKGQRNVTLTSRAGTYRRQGDDEQTILEKLRIDNRRCSPPLPDKELERIARSIARYEAGAPSTGQGADTIIWPDEAIPEEPDYLADAPPVEDSQEAPPAGGQDDDLTELMNARRLVALFGQQLRYVSEWGWMAWTGKRWERDTTGAVMRYAKETALSYYQDAAQAASAGDSDKAKELAQHAKRSQSARAIRAMVELAQSELEVIARPEDFDNDPWVLNCENGTLDLRTGELRPHDRADLLTKLCPVNYDPAATCPTWERFQNEIAGECAAIVAYKQRMYGYSLTGDVSEQAFFIAYGTGANGKSTEVNTIRAILGPDYAWHIPTESLLTKGHGGGIPNDLARLKGMRFVTAIESDLGRRLAEGLVKQLTGGDPITARYMRSEFFTFNPTHKLILATNHKPEIWGSDHAIWRRIKLIPYTVTIPKERQDKSLPDKLRAEAAGILAWLVRGCLAWQREGLAEPGEVTNATNAYRQEQDLIGEFLADRCIFNPTAQVSKGALYEAYVTWCETNKETPLSKRKFGGKLTERGDVAEDKSTGGLRVWVGIGLLAEANSGVSGASGKNSLFCKEKFSLRETNGEIAPLTPLTPLEDPDEVVTL